MTGQGVGFRGWVRDGVAGWDRFWFTPADSATLSLIRVCAGAMLFYTHLVWSLGLDAFFGPHGWLPPEVMAKLPPPAGGWSYFYWIHSTTVLWGVHLLALVVFAMLTLGIFTRVTSILAFLAAVSYANRVAPAALFGLDDTNVMLAMYLMVGASGSYFSFDAWRARRRGRAPQASVATNVAIRLIQLHLCIIYVFSGMGKLLGHAWWDGTAMWGAISNQEYQSLDMTWLANYPLTMDAVTQVALYWEVFYIALIWPRWTRPIALTMAVCVHGGIALFLGMKTFGLVMLIANLAFISPNFVRRLLQRPRDPGGTAPAEQGRGEPRRAASRRH
ncbi:MAG TPA: HTTM domain-containing protein [Pirellulales bacterium]|jgi:hypothetical protein|nr:HTTM domain-containing protein [Pirellulales bacterium]